MTDLLLEALIEAESFLPRDAVLVGVKDSDLDFVLEGVLERDLEEDLEGVLEFVDENVLLDEKEIRFDCDGLGELVCEPLGVPEIELLDVELTP